MKRVNLCAIAIFFALFSCNKSEVNLPVQTPNFIPMSVGNYWIYEHYKIDTLGIETLLIIIDSIYIPADTLINGEKYFILDVNRNGNYYRRKGFYKDSSGYLVTSDANILFSHDDYTNILSEHSEILPNDDTLYTKKVKMGVSEYEITLQAGKFKTRLVNEYIYSNRFYPGFSSPRILNDYYAEGVGLVLDNYIYLSGPHTYEKRLVSYKISN